MINKQSSAKDVGKLDETVSARTSTAAQQRSRVENSRGNVMPSNSSPDNKPQLGPPKSILREYFESLVVTVIMAMFGMTFVVQAVKVPTGSMQNTILIGDHLLVNKFIFAPGPHLPFLPQRDIKRGDIIVFKYPGNKLNPDSDRNIPNNTPFKTNYVKRVIGLPGEKIEIRGTKVFINDQLLPEHVFYIGEADHQNAPNKIVHETERKGNELYKVYWDIKEAHSFTQPHSSDKELITDSVGAFAKAGEPFIVPANHYFVLGDNRNNSQDSRYWGTVSRDLIIGRAMFVYWSYDESAPSDGFFLNRFFVNTRWSRTGTMIK
jgi:signal peptidase I